MTIERSSGNIYKDTGIPDADNMLFKSIIAAQIERVIKQRNLTQQEAAEVIGIAQPNLAALLKGRFRGVSPFKMLEYLTKLGTPVTISIGHLQDERPQSIQIAFS